MKISLVIILASLVCVMVIAAGCTSSSGTVPATTPAAKTIAPMPSAPTAKGTTTTASTATPWSGTWATTYNFGNSGLFVEVFSISQTGSYVTGTYSSGDECEGTVNNTADRSIFTGNCYGTINGTADGNKLTGIWSDTDNTGTYTGWFTFELSENGRSFHGHWVDAVDGVGALKNTTLFWNGVKV
jgi:hypothetical protein